MEGEDTGNNHEGVLEDLLAVLAIFSSFGLGNAQMGLLCGADDPLEHVIEVSQLYADGNGSFYPHLLAELVDEEQAQLRNIISIKKKFER